MKFKQVHLRQAYKDGELTTCEAASFEASLNEYERKVLLAEQEFERKAAHLLARAVQCPDAVWERTAQALRRESATVSFWRRFPSQGALMTAASIALLLSFWFVMHLPQPDERLIPFGSQGTAAASAGEVDVEMLLRSTTTVAELQAESVIPPGAEEANAFLAANHFPFRLDAGHRPGLVQAFHGVEIVGAKMSHLSGDPVLSLLASCCGQPVKMLLAQQNSRAAKQLGEAAASSGMVQTLQPLDGYVAATISDHQAPYLADMFVRQ